MGADAREFRVTWQRQGMSRPNVRIYQTERGARRLVDKLSGKVFESWDRHADDYWCCDQSGYDGCNCGGLTVAERVRRDHEAVPPMILGPVIESRPVGDWTHVETAPPDPREPWPTDDDGRVVHPDYAAAEAKAAAESAERFSTYQQIEDEGDPYAIPF